MVGKCAFVGGASNFCHHKMVGAVDWTVCPRRPVGVFTPLFQFFQSTNSGFSVVRLTHVSAIRHKHRLQGGFLSLCEFYLRFFVHFICWFKNCLYICGELRWSQVVAGLCVSITYCRFDACLSSKGRASSLFYFICSNCVLFPIPLSSIIPHDLTTHNDVCLSLL